MELSSQAVIDLPVDINATKEIAQEPSNEKNALSRTASYRSGATSCKSKKELERELRLAQIQIRKLQLEAEMSKRIESMKAEMEKELKLLENGEESIADDNIARPPSPEPAARLEAVRSYVDSLPNENFSLCEGAVAKGPGLKRTATESRSQNNLLEAAQLMRTCMSLPTRRPAKFDGNPMQYAGFMRTFQSTVAKYTNDAACLLDYLITACEGEAAEAIRRCSVLEPWEGYAEALRILERRFGEPHVIARSCIDELTDGPVVRSSDTKSLTKLADDMKLCSATLRHLNYRSDLDACRTLSAIVQRLPQQLQARWADKAAAILKTKREPTFDQLAEFISERGDSALAALTYTSRPRTIATDRVDVKKQITSHSPNKRLASVMVTQQRIDSGGTNVSSHKVCTYCKKFHYLDECPAFKELKLNEKYGFLKKAQLCFLCLKPNHGVKTCRNRRRCGLNGCSRQHHPLLHTNATPMRETEASQPLNEVASVGHLSLPKQTAVRKTALAILPVRVHGPRGELVVNAFLDSGSDTTLIDRSVAEYLGLEESTTPLTIKTLSGESAVDAGLVSFTLQSIDGREKIAVHRAWALNALPELKPMNLSRLDLKAWEHLKGVPLASMEDADVKILIGTDVPKAHWVVEQRRGDPEDPVAMKSPLGWVILGPLAPVCQFNKQVNVNYITERSVLHEQLECMFNFEFAETACIRKAMSVADQEALYHMKKSMHLIDGHYEIALPWKPGCPCLPDNKGLAMKRLMALRKRLEKDASYRLKYTAAIEDYVKRGYAELVPVMQRYVEGKRVWYLPHHGVYKHGDNTKVRVVFDCAATFERTSLNQQLYTGPDLVNSLCGVLLRFREYRFAMVADIEAMFHQVRVPNADRDCLRFLWWPDGDLSRMPENYRMTSHPFGATSSPSCASLALQKTIEKNLPEYGEEMVHMAKRAFYVDDCLLSLPTIEGLQETGMALKGALAQGGFNLTKFFSNDPRAVANFPQSDRKEMLLDHQAIEVKRTLGVRWDSARDSFVFSVASWEGKHTRRELLSYVASLYDPLGLVAPSLLPAKLLIQDLCRRKATWDEDLTSDEIACWEDCMVELQQVTCFRIPRCLIPSEHASLRKTELHAFSDASERGYGAAVYLRSVCDCGKMNCSLLISKSRVAPLKTTSIPRLELAAAVVSVKLVTFIKEELSMAVSSITYWTDSMIVLQLLKNTTSRFETYVANRLSVIRDHSDPNAWMYIDSKRNPADLASRGTRSGHPLDALWFHGPEFLRQADAVWPVQPICLSSPQVDSMEVANVNVSQSSYPTAWIQHFSETGDWIVLLRKIAWLTRFCCWLRNKSQKASCDRPLKTLDLHLAEKTVLRLVQEDGFQRELRSFVGTPASTHASRAVPGRLQNLHPFKYDSLLRVGGRLRWSPLPFESRHPVILPKNHFVTKLLIKYHYEVSGHSGSLHVLADLRERYWIVNGLSTVKNVLRSCFHCKRWLSKPCNQIMAPLPTDGMLHGESPFTAVGIDYFGPLLVKRGRGTEKRYGCIFTCLTVRAVHIEVAHTLETDSFLSAFTRFVARRGYPRVVYSDNGTNFRGAENEMKRCLQAWDQQKLSKALCERNCEWIFSPPKASHRGGVWERMIRSIRRILVCLLADQLVNDEVLATTLCEVEKILNNRPLTKVSDEPEDLSAITPNHLLLLRGIPTTIPEGSVDRTLTKRWRQAQHIADAFWARWLKDYLPELQKRSKRTKERYDLKAGDLVLLVDPQCRRGLWPKGLVVEVFPGRDGRTRDVMVRTADGVLQRDVRQLCLLENNVQGQ